jgi:hypothetical protein
MGQFPDLPRRPRRVARHIRGARCCRTGPVRLPARLQLSHYQRLGRKRSPATQTARRQRRRLGQCSGMTPGSEAVGTGPRRDSGRRPSRGSG